MSKELTPLKALETIKEITSSREQGFNTKLKNDIYYQNELNIIEKALKALEIIKERVLEIDDFNEIIRCKDEIMLTIKEYELLKEILL